jgi:lipopolysaccharide/colanic/teichoic acid biosynthesis glycosyltransferase
MRHHFRHVPLVRNRKIRTTIGFALLVSTSTLPGMILGKGRIEVIVSISAFAWLLSVLLTDKYVHKYPQRYSTYLIASHLKAAMIMAFSRWIMGRLAGPIAAPHDVLWLGLVLFTLADVVVSVPRRQDVSDRQFAAVAPSSGATVNTPERSGDSDYASTCPSSIDTRTIIRHIRSNVDQPMADFIENNLSSLQGGDGIVLVMDDLTPTDDHSKAAPVQFLIGRTRMNDVSRLNRFLVYCANRITMGGCFVGRYMPLENVVLNMKHRYTGLRYWMVFSFHFMWYRAIPSIPWLDTLYFSSKLSWLDALYLSFAKKRNRALSKAEGWGRLAFCGMHVVAESGGDGERFLIARRVGMPVQNRRPSYYPIVALEKVGLDGEIIQAHKIRSMCPFSEFLQKRIFDDHGLAAGGKFRNDFRLTGLGRLLRKYWLDELPQIYDWLRGDIKLVGIRATSRHFLSLYPKHFLDLYLQIKPGLIPPIFDPSSDGFAQIVEIELTYLQRYWDQPFRTDVRYLIQTFTDIVFKGIRSK